MIRRRQLAAPAAPCDDIDDLFGLLRDKLGKADAFISSAEYQMDLRRAVPGHDAEVLFDGECRG